MLPLPSIIHSLWFLSNLSLIILVQLKRQSEFLLHHQYNLQLISICVHYLAPFGFSSVSINNKSRVLCVCVCLCVGIRKRVTAALFHFSQLVLATLDPAFCRLSWLLPRLISWCLMLKSWKKIKVDEPIYIFLQQLNFSVNCKHIFMALRPTCPVPVECEVANVSPYAGI